ncbi:tRNA pseudouridine synthase D-like [Hydra vulgaris]|uniref:tRNA pseudouridine synthase D-like n=1 Tax=Hydra vulgaris TaxID=6087 RepID=UPI0032E9D7E3
MNIVLKKQNDDFCVNEIPIPQIYCEGQFYVYSLYKSGFTTNQAIKIIADFINCSVMENKYSGLKDEDGITTQLISLPVKFNNLQLSEFNSSDVNLQLTYRGNIKEELSIGNLLGNAFRVTARNINNHLIRKLKIIHNYKSLYLNYYGIQRFGIPNREKTTHLIGKHILDNNYEAALELLIEQNTPDVENLFTFKNQPKDYFVSIDQRQTAFYLSSYYSYQWNDKLIQNIYNYGGDNIKLVVEAIPFTFIKDQADKLRVYSLMNKQDIVRYRVQEDELIKSQSNRTTFIHVKIIISNIRDDELYPGQYCADLCFSLPSGSYATVVIPQFFYEIY